MRAVHVKNAPREIGISRALKDAESVASRERRQNVIEVDLIASSNVNDAVQSGFGA